MCLCPGHGVEEEKVQEPKMSPGSSITAWSAWCTVLTALGFLCLFTYSRLTEETDES